LRRTPQSTLFPYTTLFRSTDKYVQFDLQTSKSSIDADIGDIAAPEAVRLAQIPPPSPPVSVTAEEVGKGIWWLAGSGNHRSILLDRKSTRLNSSHVAISYA